MSNNVPDVIFFIGAGFPKIQATLPLKKSGHPSGFYYDISRDKLTVVERT